ncbi:DNA binding methylated-DNA--cysteine S-methyltransferase [Exidia glandulosa HHB12029]|uniref:Methylated-DNA--protein-cysteine methyltransferase n=1 Tax=Exidia glandulosa HHB12029 TaxID=1314781 RepID=A0A166A019_EXIGL|nr:DNA binding methylated-DNA--cysteine S-methyltransferase [Exidia glandulosa HHB12029]
MFIHNENFEPVKLADENVMQTSIKPNIKPVVVASEPSVESKTLSKPAVLTSAKHIYYPSTSAERLQYRTPEGKALTPFQWDVYDMTLTIPVGSVVTYKELCRRLKQGSPRSVGGALRRNPFAPYIPCHRIIASDLKLGGYCGEWGPGQKANRKLELLSSEGVKFDKENRLKEKNALWRD